VHSMGGLISRYYIDRLMPAGEVAQLIMLGSPMAGTACADLPASLGFYLPASLEIQPSYVEGVFNQQIIHRHGVPFYDLAGTEITDPIKSPCTQVPTDLAVSLESVSAIPLHVSQMSVLHTDLNTSPQVFEQFVKPLLQTPPGVFPIEPDPGVPTTAVQPEQFSHVFTGHVDLGQSPEVVINIEPGVAVASFALFDPTHSLDVRVVGASGKEIALGPDNLVKVDDPAALFYLGYGFNNPKPGAWKVTLLPTAATPAGGADYALTASFKGGAVLNTSTGSLLPQVGVPVQVIAQLDLNGQAQPLTQAVAHLRHPDGSQEDLALASEGDSYRGEFRPADPGLYSVQVDVTGATPDGAPLQRSAMLSLQAQPIQPVSGQSLQLLLILATIMALIFLVGIRILVIGLVRRSSRARNKN